MSRFSKSFLLAVALLVVPAIIGAAEYVSRPVDLAAIPAAPTVIDPAPLAQPASTPLNAAVGGRAGEVEASFGEGPMAENAYDFNDPHGVPGFGPLPLGFDIAPVMPRMGSR